MRRLAVLASGTGTNLQAIIDATVSGEIPDAQVVVVACNRKQAYALERARNQGIATIYHPLKPYRERYPALDERQLREQYDRDLRDALLAYRPDLLVLAGWMRLFTIDFLRAFSGRVINIHPALPGAFPGMHAIERALEAFQRGEIDRTGIMIHRVADEGVDCGPVVRQREVPIYADDTLERLEARIHSMEHQLYIEAIKTVLDEQLPLTEA